MRTACACSLLLLTTGFVAIQAHAANSQVSEKVLWSFSNGTFDGNVPHGPLVMDASGNLYGTTSSGGANILGTVFEITAGGQESVLWAFGNGDPDGSFPNGGLIMDKSGNLYGTTSFGGLFENFDSGTGGIVFELTPAGQETDLWNFGNGADGANPLSGLLLDNNGNLFGTTSSGGVYAGFNPGGTAFELTPAGQESILWSFGNGADGNSPFSALVADATGNLYGTTVFGGINGGGTVFKLRPVANPDAAARYATANSYTESILWNFGNGNDGQNPGSSVILDASGNLFGVTGAGGRYGLGTVYEVSSDGRESILWNFGNGADGQYPNGLIMDANGNLYGVTSNGGANADCSFPATSCGTVYELSPPAIAGGAWTETILYNFRPSPDGFFPSGNLLLDASGNLYGVTGAGGSNGLGGTVFELSGAVPNGQIALSSQHIQFPKTSVGGSSSYQLAIRNTGTGQLSGTLATPPAPFGLQGSGSFNLAPHTQTKITLTFKPAAADRAHQRATITSTSLKQNSIQLDLRGIGTAPSPSLALNEAPR